MLNKEQEKAFELVKKGSSVFITGSAGTGKSFLVNICYEYLVEKYSSYEVHKTSSTGISAMLIGGKTIHSWGGIKLGEGTPTALIAGMSYFIKKRWQRAKVLFIDEISMITPELFEKLEEIARILRNTDLHFGGIQVIIIGDFCQLPPVKNKRFCFESNMWNLVVEHTVVLIEIVRQRDIVFQKLLNNVRQGFIKDDESDILKLLVGKELVNEYKIEPTVLYPRNKDVNELNAKKLSELLKNEEKYELNAKFTKEINKRFEGNKSILESMYQKFKEDETTTYNNLVLCKGAQVIFKKNIDEFVANGTRGIVEGFTEEIIELTGKKVRYPKVRLLNGMLVDAVPFCFEYTVKNEFIFTKEQIPLKLGWACSIHSSQGSSIDLLKVSIGKGVFEYGQGYVALSRARTLEGLTLIDYDRNCFTIHPKVEEYYKQFFVNE